MSAARVCLVLAAATTPARSSRLFLPSHVPPNATAINTASTAPKPSARRAPIRICRKTMSVFRGAGRPAGRPPQAVYLAFVDSAADDHVLEAAQVHLLRLDLARHRVHELVVLPALGVGALGHHLDALLHEVLAVVVAQLEHVLADHLLVRAVGEDLALQVVDDDVEVAVDPRRLLAAEVGE